MSCSPLVCAGGLGICYGAAKMLCMHALRRCCLCVDCGDVQWNTKRASRLGGVWRSCLATIAMQRSFLRVLFISIISGLAQAVVTSVDVGPSPSRYVSACLSRRGFSIPTSRQCAACYIRLRNYALQFSFAQGVVCIVSVSTLIS